MANPVQLGLAGGLMMTLIWGGFELNRDNRVLPQPPAPGGPPLAETPPLPELQPPPIEDYSAAIERPLFFSDRKLPEKVTESKTATSKNSSKAVASNNIKPPDLKVTGILLEGEQSSALVEMLASGNYRRLSMGETVAGWKLVEVTARDITLQSGRKRQTFKLHQFAESAPPKTQNRRPRNNNAVRQTRPSARSQVPNSRTR